MPSTSSASTIRRSRLLAGAAAIAFCLAGGTAARADIITSGSVNPGNLTTNNTTTAQIFAGIGSAGSIEVNANANTNGFTVLNGNAASSISVNVGAFGGGNGTVTVTGNGTAGSAALNAIRSIQVGIQGGTGTLTVSNGGQVQSVTDTYGLTVGNSSSTGTVTVTGAGSSLISRDRINVGSFNGSNGTLDIAAGGKVQTAGSLEGNIVIGADTDAQGKVTVSGAGSQLLANGFLVGAGTNGTSTLTVSNGGFASAATLASGQGGGLSVGGDNAAVTVTGTGSKLQVEAISNSSSFLFQKEVIIGGFAKGSVTVDQSAAFDVAGGRILLGGGFFGNQFQTASLTVKNGASVTAGEVVVAQGATLNGAGGTINAAVTLNGGTLAPGNSPGTMSIDGDLNLQTGTLELEIGPGGLRDHLNVSGAINIATDMIISLILNEAPIEGEVIALEDFFSGYTDFGVDPDFDLASQLLVSGAAGGPRFTVSFGGSDIAFGGPTDVPAPATLALLGTALAGLGLFRRRAA